MQKTLGQSIKEGGKLKPGRAYPFTSERKGKYQIWLFHDTDFRECIAFSDVFDSEEECQRKIDEIMEKYKEWLLRER